MRRAWIWAHDRLVPYPLQHNIHRLPPEVIAECRAGIEALRSRPAPRASREVAFAGWIEAAFGEGLARHFMYPYNEKVWAHPLETLSCHWQGERVPAVDLDRISLWCASRRAP